MRQLFFPSVTFSQYDHHIYQSKSFFFILSLFFFVRTALQSVQVAAVLQFCSVVSPVERDGGEGEGGHVDGDALAGGEQLRTSRNSKQEEVLGLSSRSTEKTSWLTLQSSSPNTQRPMKVESGVSGTDTETRELL